MNEEIYAFIHEDFTLINELELQKLSDRELMDSLQGTLVGIDALSSMQSKIEQILTEANLDSACKEEFAKPTLHKLEAGLDTVTQLLLERIGHERVRELVRKTLELIELEKKED
jgi:hypothetical protein